MKKALIFITLTVICMTMTVVSDSLVAITLWGIGTIVSYILMAGSLLVLIKRVAKESKQNYQRYED